MDAINEEYVEQLRREYIEGMDHLFAVNADLVERLRASKVAAIYDLDDDLLEITLNGPQEALSYSIHHSLYLRADFESLKIVGVELQNFRSHIAENSPEAGFCWSLLQLAGVDHVTIRSEAPGAPKADVFDAVRELVTTE